MAPLPEHFLCCILRPPHFWPLIPAGPPLYSWSGRQLLRCEITQGWDMILPTYSGLNIIPPPQKNSCVSIWTFRTWLCVGKGSLQMSWVKDLEIKSLWILGGATKPSDWGPYKQKERDLGMETPRGDRDPGTKAMWPERQRHQDGLKSQ